MDHGAREATKQFMQNECQRKIEFLATLWLNAVLLGGCITMATAQGQPMVIAWQAPAGPDAPLWAGYNPRYYQNFWKYILPNISGIGVVVPWGQVDNCSSQSTQCSPDSYSGGCGGNCYQWNVIDATLMDYIQALHTGQPNTWNNGCAGGKPCKIVLIVWLTQDSGNINTFAGLPNTPQYVFNPAYSGNAGFAPQDVMACKDRQGGTGGGWPPLTNPGVIDPCWSNPSLCGGNDGSGDFGVWNATSGPSSPVILQNRSHGMTINSPPFNFSGYPVMYEAPIMTAAEKFASALAVHYSSGCTFSSCTTTIGSHSISGATIAPYIAYMRIGLSSGGENYPYCAATSATTWMGPPGKCNVSGNAFWPGPNGQSSEPQCYTDQGYLTAWANGDGTGYVEQFYQNISSDNWAFPVTTPSHEGPPANSSTMYADAEAQLANQYGLGTGMQSASIGDLVTYVNQSSPSTDADWAVHFLEFPNVPVHHMQAESPGSPEQAAEFTISSFSVLAGTATIVCSSNSGLNDCSVFCTNHPFVYISGNPVVGGIIPVFPQQGPGMGQCNTNQISFSTSLLAGTYPAIGYVYSPDHLPILLPFEAQRCSASFATICSSEVWETILDWTYGTTSISGSYGNTTSYPDFTYESAISNFLAGQPAYTSMHTNVSTNASQY
jgi:hypothetical protein